MKKKSKKLDKNIDRQELFRFIHYLIKMQWKEGKLKAGDSYYIISLNWYNNFEKSASSEEKSNEFAQNSLETASESSNKNSRLSLLKQNPKEDLNNIFNFDLIQYENVLQEINQLNHFIDIPLKRDIKRNSDYIIIPELAWIKLTEHYNAFEIKRVVGKTNWIDDLMIRLEVLFYPLNLNETKSPSILYLHREWTTKMILNKILSVIKAKNEKKSLAFSVWKLEITFEEFKQRIYNIESKTAFKNRKIILKDAQQIDFSKSKEEINLSNEDKIFIEISENAEMLFQEDDSNIKKENSSINIDSIKINSINDILSKSSSGGKVGLINLGNSCYINASVQCLSNTLELTLFFLSKKFIESINKTNPLGYKGDLAIEWSKLLTEIWLKPNTFIKSEKIKKLISEKNDLFKGMHQQDSSEFLFSLIDGLHEDLNLNGNGKFFQHKTYDNLAFTKEEEASNECWKYFTALNSSIIVDLFYGQNLLITSCPKCNYYSSKFDPFLSISLSIPNNALIEVKYISYNWEEKPIILSFNIFQFTQVSEIIKQFQKSFKIKNFLFCMEDSKSNLKLLNEKDIPYQYREENKFTVFEAPDNLTNYHYTFVKIYYSKKRIIRSNIHLEVNQLRLFYYKKDSLIKSIKEELNIKLNEFFKYSSKYFELSSQKISEKSKIIGSDLIEGYHAFFITDILKKQFSPFGKTSLCKICNKSHDNHCNISNFDDIISFEILKSKNNIKGFNLDIELIGDVWQKIIPKINEDYDHINLEGKPFISEKISLDFCLENFKNVEQLDQDNLWKCEKCHSNVRAAKETYIYKLPKILIIHLKRFSCLSMSKASSPRKNDVFVDFPEQLNVSKYTRNCTTEYNYQLYSLINHHGTMKFGHYTSMFCHPAIKKWIEYNDERVASILNPCSQYAYILFYKLIN